MSTSIGTAHIFNPFGGYRAITRTSGPLFCPQVLEHLAHSAARYRRDTEGPDALAWASAIALFEFSRHASIEAA